MSGNVKINFDQEQTFRGKKLEYFWMHSRQKQSKVQNQNMEKCLIEEQKVFCKRQKNKRKKKVEMSWVQNQKQ